MSQEKIERLTESIAKRVSLQITDKAIKEKRTAIPLQNVD
jgi:hypothetical protein